MDDIDPRFEYQGRQFCAFDETFEEGDSTYFDIDHETGQRVSRMFRSTPYQDNSPFTFNDVDFSTSDQNDIEEEAVTSACLKKRKSRSREKSCPRLFELRSTPSRLSRLSSATSEAEILRLSSIMSSGQILRSGKLKTGNGEELLNNNKKYHDQSPFVANKLKKMLFSPGNDSSNKNTETSLLNTNDENKFATVAVTSKSNNFEETTKRHVRFAESTASTPEMRSPLVDKRQLTPYRVSNGGINSYALVNLKEKTIFTNVNKSYQRDILSNRKSMTTPHSRRKMSTVRIPNSECKSLAKISHIKPSTTRMQRNSTNVHLKFTPSGRTKIETTRESPLKQFVVQGAGASIGSEKETRRSVLKTTVAKPFKFETDKRVKDQKQTMQKDVDFVNNLRHNSPKNVDIPRRTKPKPFSFDQTSKKRKRDVSESKTLAEKVNSYLKNTPARFRTKAAGTEFQPQEMTVHELVKPRSPKLQSQMRQRQNQAISQEQREEMEFQEIKSYKFHAQPFNKRLLRSPHLQKPPVKQSTIPADVHLQTEKRNDVRKIPEEEDKYVFHAREVPKNILQGPVGLKERRPIPVTQPKSPAFALKKRCEEWRNSTSSVTTEILSTTFKAQPAPNCASPFVVKKNDKKCTASKPFSFEQHDKQRYALKEKRIQEEIENDKKQAEFHAHPLPLYDSKVSSNTTVVKAQLTKPAPFSFEWQKKTIKKDMWMLKQIEDRENVVKFKAQPAAIIKKRPFIPKKPIRSATVATGFQLSTDERATKRMKLRELQATAEAEKECLLLQQQKEKEEQKKEEIKQLRQALVHKANPVKCYKPLYIKPSQKSLTRPQSPKFATETRVALRNETLSP